MLYGPALLILPLLLGSFGVATPVKTVKLPAPSKAALHTCTVFVQRWYDNSLDIYGYGYTWVNDASGPANFMGAESTALSPGQSIQGVMGSHPIVVTDVKNPAVVNGNTNWNDPGALSFTWGTQSFDSQGPSSPCTVIPVGPYGASFGYPTNTTCHFPCDS